MKRITALILCLLAGHAYAQEQPRIPDLSLSPEESFRQPDISHSQSDGFGTPTNPQDFGHDNADYTPGAYNTGGASSFMAGYCDPNFKPIIANAPGLSALQSCLETQKRQSCDEFQHLPADAQAALDSVIDCMQSDSDTADGQRAADDPGCLSGDTQRLRLLKKYWHNEAITHALVFMPDDIVAASGKCMQGAR
jgi:hypothetical protein